MQVKQLFFFYQPSSLHYCFFDNLVENHMHLLKIQRTSIASASGGNKIRGVAVRFI
jgi:hypothetical protein